MIEGFLTPGNTADISVAQQLFEDIYGCYCALDMGYDSDAFRAFLESQNNIPVIPGRKNRTTQIQYDKKRYKLRKRIEQFFGRIKENKRLTVRFEKNDHILMAFIALAAIKMLI